MAATRANDPYALVPGRAAGYTRRDGTLRNAAYYSPSGTYAAGVLLSTVADLARWVAALHTDALLPQRALARCGRRTARPRPRRRGSASR